MIRELQTEVLGGTDGERRELRRLLIQAQRLHDLDFRRGEGAGGTDIEALLRDRAGEIELVDGNGRGPELLRRGVER